MSRSSITLSIATWIRSARSGSSLIATMPRWLRGISPKWIVSGSPSERPSATFIGSTSPIRSATLVSGRGQLLGVPLVAVPPLDRQVVAELGGPALRLVDDRLVGVLAELGAGDHRRPLVEQPDQGAQQPGLALAALAEQHDVVAGDQRPLELRDDGVLEAVQPGPRVAALAQRGEQVVADLGAQRLLDVAGRAELADGADARGREQRSRLHATQRINNWTAASVSRGVTVAGVLVHGVSLRLGRAVRRLLRPAAPPPGRGGDRRGADALALRGVRRRRPRPRVPHLAPAHPPGRPSSRTRR